MYKQFCAFGCEIVGTKGGRGRAYDYISSYTDSTVVNDWISETVGIENK